MPEVQEEGLIRIARLKHIDRFIGHPVGQVLAGFPSGDQAGYGVARIFRYAVLIATDSVNYIAQWMLTTFPVFQSI